MLSTLYWLTSSFTNTDAWLLLSITNHDIELFKTTLADGANPNAVFDSFDDECRGCLEPVLYTAVEQNQFEMAKTLIEHGAATNHPVHACSFLPKIFARNTSLISAVRNNNIEMVKLLLDNGAESNFNKTNFVLTKIQPLYEAVAQDNVEIAKLLLESGADVNHGFVTETYGNDKIFLNYNSPLYKASSVEMIKLLLSHGAEISGSMFIDHQGPHWFEPALIHALNNKDTAKVQLLIEAGADIQALKDDPHFDNMIIELLKTQKSSNIDWVFELDGPEQLGMSQAHIAALKGDVKTLISLNESQVDVNVTDKLGYTPFHYTYFIDASKENTSVHLTQEMLIKMGADLNAASCIEGYVGKPVWQTMSLFGNHDLTQMMGESFRIKTFEEGYKIQYDEQSKSVTYEKISGKSEATVAQELQCLPSQGNHSTSLALSDVIHSSNDIAGLENTTIPSSHSDMKTYLSPMPLAPLQELTIHTDF